MESPPLTSLPNIPPFCQLMDMPHTKVVSSMYFSPSSTYASSIEVLHPPLNRKLEDDLASWKGHNKSLFLMDSGSSLACVILVMEANLLSLELVTTPLPKVSHESQVSYPPLTQLTHGTLIKCMFKLLEDIATLSSISKRSVTLLVFFYEPNRSHNIAYGISIFQWLDNWRD